MRFHPSFLIHSTFERFWLWHGNEISPDWVKINCFSSFDLLSLQAHAESLLMHEMEHAHYWIRHLSTRATGVQRRNWRWFENYTRLVGCTLVEYVCHPRDESTLLTSKWTHTNLFDLINLFDWVDRYMKRGVWWGHNWLDEFTTE